MNPPCFPRTLVAAVSITIAVAIGWTVWPASQATDEAKKKPAPFIREEDLADAAVATRPAYSAPPPTTFPDTSTLGLLEWAERAPLDAIAWAENQPQSERERFVRLVAQRWAERDPAAAFAWLIRQPNDIMSLATEAVAIGISSHPRLAVEFGTMLQSRASPFASVFNGALIGALSAAAQFAPAEQISLARENPEAPDWENLIYRRWGAADPIKAAAQLHELPQGTSRDAAFLGLIEGWAARSPRDLADYARALPAGPDRSHALDVAVLAWAKIDPAGLAEWSSTLGPGPVKDAALSLAVATTDRDNCRLDVALGWVDAISDRVVRRQALRDLVQQSQEDVTSMRWYLLQARWLRPEELIEFQHLAADPPRSSSTAD